jgi:hypothetical protein
VRNQWPRFNGSFPDSDPCRQWPLPFLFTVGNGSLCIAIHKCPYVNLYIAAKCRQ